MNTLRLRAPVSPDTAPFTKLFLKQVYQRYARDSVADAAGALSYYFVFALFPFLFLLTTLTAYVPYLRTSADTLLSRARDILPPQAMQLVSAHVQGLVGTPRPRFWPSVSCWRSTPRPAAGGVDPRTRGCSRGHQIVDGTCDAWDLAYGSGRSRFVS